MRWLFITSGLLSLFLGFLALLQGMQDRGDHATKSAIRQALRQQAKVSAEEIRSRLADAEGQASNVAKSLFTDKRVRKNLDLPEGLVLIIAKNGQESRELAAKGFENRDDLRTFAKNLLNSSQRTLRWEDSQKNTFLGIKANQGSFALIAPMELVLGPMRLASALHPWLAMSDGTLLFHNSPRLVGMNSTNIRPVAQGAELLKRAESAEHTGTYLGFDGKEASGSWVTLGEWGLIVGSEWSKLESRSSVIHFMVWLGVGLLCFGAFAVGICFVPRPIQVLAARSEAKDLSFEARSFIKRAEKQAEEAVAFAREREEVAQTLEQDAREQIGAAKRTRWVFERTEAFLEDAIEARSENEIWSLLADYLSGMTMQAPVLVYTYSPSSCTLVPQAKAGTESFPEPAQRFLSESRILLGNIEQLAQLQTNSAYNTWRERWERFMPLEGLNIVDLPFASPTGSRGVLIFLFSENHRMNAQELERQKELWSLFAYRAGWLYDLKKRLLQSSNANKKTKTLSPDILRDRSPGAEA